MWNENEHTQAEKSSNLAKLQNYLAAWKKKNKALITFCLIVAALSGLMGWFASDPIEEPDAIAKEVFRLVESGHFDGISQYYILPPDVEALKKRGPGQTHLLGLYPAIREGDKAIVGYIISEKIEGQPDPVESKGVLLFANKSGKWRIVTSQDAWEPEEWNQVNTMLLEYAKKMGLQG